MKDENGIDISALRQKYRGRIQHDPNRRGNLFARLMTDQVLFDYRLIDRTQVDKDCDTTRRTPVYQIARDCLSLHGLSVPETNAQIIDKALRMDNQNSFVRAYSRDSFPGIMDSIGQKSLVLGFENPGETWPFFVRETETKDFKPYTRVSAPEFPAPTAVEENGEIPRPTLGDDSKETGQVENHGFIIEVSRQAAVNDDLRALTLNSAAAGRASSRAIGDAVYALLLANTALTDGFNLFSSDHGNLGAPAAPSVSALDEMRGLFAAQQGPSGSSLNLRVQLLVGAPERESTLAVLGASSDMQTHPLTPGYSLAPAIVTDSRLTGSTKWFGFTDPAVSSVIEVVTLENSREPLLERKTIWASEGISWRVLHDFDAIATGYRGAAMNAGT